MPDNKEASMVYNIVQNQFIMGFNGPVDLNQSAVWECIDRYRVKDPIKVFERVINCSRTILREMRESD